MMPKGVWIGVVVLVGTGSLREAVEFRMENKVYQGQQREPAVETDTIFYQGRVYDFLKKPAEVTILDRESQRVILLDTQRRVKTILQVEELEAFVERLRRRATEYSDPFVGFLARPEFEKHFDSSARELTLSSPWMIYRVVTVEAESPELAAEYRMFADVLARLNALLNPKGLPPFARLVLNAELERRKVIPQEVHLTIQPDRGLLPRRAIGLRSVHKLFYPLDEADRSRVQQALEFQNLFPQVSFEQYQKDHLEK